MEPIVVPVTCVDRPDLPPAQDAEMTIEPPDVPGGSHVEAIGNGGCQSGSRSAKRSMVVPPVAPYRPAIRRILRASVVNIKRDEHGPSYAQILKEAREKVDLKEIGINESRIRWTSGGSLLIEVLGFDRDIKADFLANRLRTVLEGKAAISRPTASGELRLWGLDVYWR